MSTPRILVIGLGTLGRALVEELRRRPCELWVADLDPARTDRIKDEVDQAVAMDATDLHALKEIRAASFDRVIICLGSSFEAAERTTLQLEDLGAPNVICVATTRQRGEILSKLGSHLVVMPGLLQARNLAVEVSEELVESFRSIDANRGLVEILLVERLVLTIAEVDEIFGAGMRVVAVGRRKDDGTREFDCDLAERIEANEGDSLLVFGSPRDVVSAVRRKLR